jgi:hypothetical protein
MALLSNTIILVTNLYLLQLFVETLVCLQHLQSGTKGLTDAPVLPRLQLTWLLIINYSSANYSSVLEGGQNAICLFTVIKTNTAL